MNLNSHRLPSQMPIKCVRCSPSFTTSSTSFSTIVPFYNAEKGKKLKTEMLLHLKSALV